jgi:hypothetical protein
MDGFFIAHCAIRSRTEEENDMWETETVDDVSGD